MSRLGIRRLKPSEVLRVKKLRDLMWSWDAIGKDFGMQSKRIRRQVDLTWHLAEKERERRRHHGDSADVVTEPVKIGARLHIPQRVLAERERAHAVQHTIAQAYLGDPLPGRSALDRRKALSS